MNFITSYYNLTKNAKYVNISQKVLGKDTTNNDSNKCQDNDLFADCLSNKVPLSANFVNKLCVDTYPLSCTKIQLGKK